MGYRFGIADHSLLTIMYLRIMYPKINHSSVQPEGVVIMI